MADINKIPSIPPRDDTWTDYHRDMTEKHALFVRHIVGNGTPYYADNTLQDVMNYESDGFIEVLNCEWNPGSWDTQPYMWRINLYHGVTSEVFSDNKTIRPNYSVGLCKAGERRDGVWSEKMAQLWGGLHYFRDVSSDYVQVSLPGVRAVHDNGRWRAGSTVQLDEVDDAPYDLLMKLAGRLKAGNLRGFYDDDVDYLAEIGGLRRDQI